MGGEAVKNKLFKIITVLLIFVFFMGFKSVNLNAKVSETQVDYKKVLETRFLNMLNHNFVYSEDFENLDDIDNNSAIALLNQKDGDHIETSVLNTY